MGCSFSTPCSKVSKEFTPLSDAPITTISTEDPGQFRKLQAHPQESPGCTLDLANQNISDDNLELDVLPALLTPLNQPISHSGSPSWQALNLKNNIVTPRGAHQLALFLSKPQTCSLHSIYLHNNQWWVWNELLLLDFELMFHHSGDDGVLSLSQALKHNTRLKILGLDSNHISGTIETFRFEWKV